MPPFTKGKGRLGKNRQPVRTYYEISGNLYTSLEKRDEATKQLVLFILATNNISGSLSMADMLSTYKSQQAVKKGLDSLKAQDEYFPDMKKKPMQTQTGRWVFHCFAGIDLLTINEQQALLLNIKTGKPVIIKILGSNYQRIYS